MGDIDERSVGYWVHQIWHQLKKLINDAGNMLSVKIAWPLSGQNNVKVAIVESSGAPAVSMQRTTASILATIANGAALSDAFDFSPYALGTIHMPAAWTAASIGFKAATEQSGTFQPVYDDLGVLVQIPSPTASNSYALPAALAGCRYVKLWSQNGAGVDTNQVAEAIIGVSLKA